MFYNKDLDYSVEARFGKIIPEKKWGIVPFALYLYQKELGLAIHDVWFLEWIIIHRWSDDNPYPSMTKMSKITGVSGSYLREISKDLQDRDFIRVEPRFGESGRQGTNIYHLEPLYKKLESLIQKEKPDEIQHGMEAVEYQPELAAEPLPERKVDKGSNNNQKTREELESMSPDEMTEWLESLSKPIKAKIERNRKTQ